MRGRLITHVALMVLLLAGCARPDGLPGAPPELPALLELTPASVVARGLFYSDVTRSNGFGSALPLAATSTGPFGFTLGDVSQILESGGPPLTLLRGSFDRRRLEEGFVANGYESRDQDGWLVLERLQDAAAHVPFAVAVPAAALREGVLVLGSAREVKSVVRGEDVSAADLSWPLVLAQTAGGDADAVVIAPPPELDRHVRQLGVPPRKLLERARVPDDLPGYQGYVLAHGSDDGTGVLGLAFGHEAGGPDVAAVVIKRLATSSLVGEWSRRLATDVEPQGPRWFEEHRLVRMPLVWREFAPERVRADVERSRYAFLVPDRGAGF